MLWAPSVQSCHLTPGPFTSIKAYSCCLFYICLKWKIVFISLCSHYSCLQRNAESLTSGLSSLSSSLPLPDDWNKALGGKDRKARRRWPWMNFSQMSNARWAVFLACLFVKSSPVPPLVSFLPVKESSSGDSRNSTVLWAFLITPNREKKKL